MSRWLSLGRLRALRARETIQTRRDRLTFAMMPVIALAQLLPFGFAINTDPGELPAALVAPTPDRFTRAMVSALELTGYYRFTAPDASATQAEAPIARGEGAFVVTVPSDFGRRVERGDHPTILIEADATDPSIASGPYPRWARSPRRRCCARPGPRQTRPGRPAATCRSSCIAATTQRASPSTTSCPGCWG